MVDDSRMPSVAPTHASLAPVDVGQRRLGAGAVGVHDVAVVIITAQYVGNDFAESLGINALVYVLDGVVHIFFRSRNATHIVSLFNHDGISNRV